ncbi:MAG: hypothetical protein M1827_003248 [Pycnora praestabilis]|nr:MAG: hypothetical protein M1827_003248 [Pycnora praestabilis]
MAAQFQTPFKRHGITGAIGPFRLAPAFAYQAYRLRSRNTRLNPKSLGLIARSELMSSSTSRKKPLIQSTLTSAFFRAKTGKDTEERSPFFKKPFAGVSETSYTTNDDPDNKEASGSSSARQATLDPNDISSKREATPSTKHSSILSLIAHETKSLLPSILKTVPSAPSKGYLYIRSELDYLSIKYCPNFTFIDSIGVRKSGTRVEVLDGDTLDVAIGLSARPTRDNKPVCILNMANAYHGGGGWLQGALAQEEAICYRSSLSFTLKRDFYPLPELSGIYSPTVLVIRESLANGHNLLDLSRPADLPIVSAVSVAALRDPPTTDGGTKYGRERDRKAMLSKMRMVLRIAAFNGHRRLVLGALGCGAFHNPREEVVQCWKDVFMEREFEGGWWENVTFAVLDDVGRKEGGKEGMGNYGVFYRELDGLIV